MKRELRFFAVAPGLVLVLATTGCESDVKPVGDILASDSTLALDVLGAKPDSIQGIGDTITPVDSIVIPEVASAAPAEEPVDIEPAERQTKSAVAPKPLQKKVAARRSSTNTMSRPASRSQTTAATSVSATSGRAWLILPVGSELEFEANQQICSANGSDFNATLAESVVRANGTVIPDGASARGSIVSLASANSTDAPQIRIKSLTFDGNTYAVSTRVTRADTKKIRTKPGSAGTKVAAGAGIGAAAGGILGRDAKSAVIGAAGGAIAGAIAGRNGGTYASCVPDGGHIIAELTEPLRIPLGG